MSKKTISVIIPCFNSSETLSRAIKSVESQTRKPDEVIVVDDCSDDPDEIRSVLKAHPDVRLIRNKENIGLAGSRNAGIQATECDIVAFLDADDECHPERLEKQLKYVASDAVVTCDSINPLCMKSYPVDTMDRIETYSSPILNMLFPSLTGAAMMAEVGLLKSIGGYDSDLRACEDYELWLRLLEEGVTVIRITKPLYYYHDSPGSLSKNSFLIAQSMLFSVGQFIVRNYPEKSVTASWIWFLVLSKIYTIVELNKIPDTESWNLWERCPSQPSSELSGFLKVLSKTGFYKLSAAVVKVLKKL